jgi:hypothetical protein
MKNKNEKGVFELLKGKKKDKKSSCCCGFQIEEIPDEKDESTDSKSTKEEKSCCD